MAIGGGSVVSIAVTAQSGSDGEWEGLVTRLVAAPGILTTLLPPEATPLYRCK